MKFKHNYSGFTLIELVIVIVILGVLSAVAAPKFINLTSDANTAVIKAVSGAMKATSNLVHQKAIINNIDDGSMTIDGNNITIESGFISGHWNNAWRYSIDIGKEIGFTSASSICTLNDLCGVGNQRNAPSLPISTTTRGLVLIWPEGMRLSDLCYAYYYNPKTGEDPSIGYVIDGC